MKKYNNDMPFLEKFAGKTSRIGKQGITALVAATSEELETNRVSNV
jgi:hypothetical protein